VADEESGALLGRVNGNAVDVGQLIGASELKIWKSEASESVNQERRAIHTQRVINIQYCL